MDDALVSLLAASVVFVGGHFVLSHPLRAGLVRMLGEKGFLGLYSLVSLGAFVWMVLAFRAAPQRATPLWNGQYDVPWIVGSVLTLIAMVLLVGSFRGNPALPDTPAAKVEAAEPRGVFAVTRHPMMWAFALWAIAHILVAPTPRTLIVAGAILILALLGAHLQDRKKEALLGNAWVGWERKTSYWPRPARLLQAGWLAWLLGLVLWLAGTWAHIPSAYVAAGVWLWLG